MESLAATPGAVAPAGLPEDGFVAALAPDHVPPLGDMAVVGLQEFGRVLVLQACGGPLKRSAMDAAKAGALYLLPPLNFFEHLCLGAPEAPGKIQLPQDALRPFRKSGMKRRSFGALAPIEPDPFLFMGLAAFLFGEPEIPSLGDMDPDEGVALLPLIVH